MQTGQLNQLFQTFANLVNMGCSVSDHCFRRNFQFSSIEIMSVTLTVTVTELFSVDEPSRLIYT